MITVNFSELTTSELNSPQPTTPQLQTALLKTHSLAVRILRHLLSSFFRHTVTLTADCHPFKNSLPGHQDPQASCIFRHISSVIFHLHVGLPELPGCQSSCAHSWVIDWSSPWQGPGALFTGRCGRYPAACRGGVLRCPLPVHGYIHSICTPHPCTWGVRLAPPGSCTPED